MNNKIALHILLTLISAASVNAELVVSVQIDGHSRLVISSGDNATTDSNIVWDHLFAARPGTFGGNYPTLLNGYAWFPSWPDTPNGSPGAIVAAHERGSQVLDQRGITCAAIWPHHGFNYSAASR